MDPYYVKRRLITTIIIIGVVLPIFAFIFITYYLIESSAKANLRIDMNTVTGPVTKSWAALAQGGETRDPHVFAKVSTQLKDLNLRYIRVDHIYDFYNVVARDESGHLMYNWKDLDSVVCDIYGVGARPFFVLGYMPPALTSDGSMVSAPTSWDEWSEVVQKTIERYSATNTPLCGGLVRGEMMNNLYYEVWNEPDLETFGKWSLYGGDKNYLSLYSYSSIGASHTTNVQRFNLGGPATTSAYRNWLQIFLEYVENNNLRIDFISWHRYTKDIQDLEKDLSDRKEWLPAELFRRYHNIPTLVTEWGLDSNVNPENDTQMGAAHFVAATSTFVKNNLDIAFHFEVIDGPTKSFGVIKSDGTITPRYNAMKLLNRLEGYRLSVDGESKYIKAIATKTANKISIMISNFDPENIHGETVPISLDHMPQGTYRTTVYRMLTNTTLNAPPTIISGDVRKEASYYVSPNDVLLIEMQRE